MDLTQEVDKLLEEVEEPNNYGDETTTIVPMEGKLTNLDLNPPEHRFFGKSRCIPYQCLTADENLTLAKVATSLFKRRWTSRASTMVK
jgi:hypothetical protein